MNTSKKFTLISVKSELVAAFENWKASATTANAGFNGFILSAIANKVQHQDQDVLRDFFTACNDDLQFSNEIYIATRLLDVFANLKPAFNANKEFSLKPVIGKGAKDKDTKKYDDEQIKKHDEANANAIAAFELFISEGKATVFNPAAFRKNAVEGTAITVEKEFQDVYTLVKALDYKPKTPKDPVAPTAITSSTIKEHTNKFYNGVADLEAVEDREVSFFSLINSLAYKMTAKEKHGKSEELTANVASVSVIDAMIEQLQRVRSAVELGHTVANVSAEKSDNLKEWESKVKGETESK